MKKASFIFLILSLAVLLSACGQRTPSVPPDSQSASMPETTGTPAPESRSEPSSEDTRTQGTPSAPESGGTALLEALPDGCTLLDGVGRVWTEEALGEPRDLTVMFDAGTDMYRLRVLRFAESARLDVWFDPDGTVTDVFSAPLGTYPARRPAGDASLEWDSLGQKLYRLHGDGSVETIPLPDCAVLGPEGTNVDFSPDETRMLYAADESTVGLYDLEARSVVWTMPLAALAEGADAAIYQLRFLNDHTASVTALDPSGIDGWNRWLELGTRRAYQPEYAPELEALREKGRLSDVPLDETRYLWLPFSHGEPVRLAERTGDRFKLSETLGFQAQEYRLSADGAWVVFLDRDKDTGECTFTVCDAETLTPRWTARIAVRNADNLGYFTPLCVSDGGAVIAAGAAYSPDSGWTAEFYRLSAPEK